MKICVLIPLHNGLPETQEALRSLFVAISAAVGTSIQVVAVDDGSTDGSAAWIAANYPTVHVLQGSGDLWWSGAMNVAARYAVEGLAADYCVCWNNDIRCATDYFVRLSAIVSIPAPPLLLASKVHLLESPETLYAFGCKFDGRRPSTLIGFGQHSVVYSQRQEVDWAPGMGTVIQKSVFATIGYWDADTFPQYHGDSDFGLRARSAGIPMVAYPELRIWNDCRTSGIQHKDHWGPFLRSFVRLNSNYHLTTQVRFVKRHASSWRAGAILATMYGAYVGSFFKWRVLGAVGIHRKDARPAKGSC